MEKMLLSKFDTGNTLGRPQEESQFQQLSKTLEMCSVTQKTYNEKVNDLWLDLINLMLKVLFRPICRGENGRNHCSSRAAIHQFNQGERFKTILLVRWQWCKDHFQGKNRKETDTRESHVLKIGKESPGDGPSRFGCGQGEVEEGENARNARSGRGGIANRTGIQFWT